MPDDSAAAHTHQSSGLCNEMCPAHSPAKRDRLWAKAQGPRDPRSPEYMRGIRETLDFLAGITPREKFHNPYPPATADWDAWFAGNREGHQPWAEATL